MPPDILWPGLSGPVQWAAPGRSAHPRPRNPMQPYVICVLGMHRSGTSLVSGLLGHLGFSHGPPEAMMPPNEFNPRGYWEHQPLVDINDALLAMFGGRWASPPDFPPRWHERPELEPLRQEARRILETDFGQTERWVWKDPRTCLTLPFWQPLIPSARFILCIRNPRDVALSLRRRDNFPLAAGGQLWLRYLASAVRHTAGRPRMILSYEELGREPHTGLERLGRFVGLALPLDSPETARAWSKVVDPSLGHFRSPLAEVLNEAELPYPVRASYLLLALLSQNGEGHLSVPTDGTEAGELLQLVLDSAEAQLAGQSTDHDAELAERSKGWLNDRLDESQQEIESLRAALADRDHALDSVARSRSWRITAPLRRAMELLRGRR